MEYQGLSLAVDAFDFNEDVHNDDPSKYRVSFEYQVKVYGKQFVSTIDMQYYHVDNRVVPVASIRATLKFWTVMDQANTACAQRALFAIKTLHRFTCFTLYQRLTEHDIHRFYLPTPTDKEFFKTVKTEAMAELEFDGSGNYIVSF